MNLHEVWAIFNLLIKNYNVIEKYLGENASFFHSKAFEKGICKIISGKNGVMTGEEKLITARFRQEIVLTSKNGKTPNPCRPAAAHGKKYKGNKL